MKSEKNLENACLAVLRELERDNEIVERFRAFDSSSWILIKNIIFERSLSYLGFQRMQIKNAMSGAVLFIAVISLFHYIIKVFRFRQHNLFIGAGSGVYSYMNDVIDSYLPDDLCSSPGKPTDGTLYLLSVDHGSKMWAQRAYLRKHRAIVYSLLAAPLRLVLGRMLASLLPLNQRLSIAAHDVSARLAEISVDISPQQILRLHARFCIGYLLYRLLLLPLKVRCAYVVSAYSNSELVAVLRRMGVEVIEVQHGVIGVMHRGYNYATRNSRLAVPDKINVYNNFWRDELLAAGFFTSNQIVIKQRLKYSLANHESSTFKFPYIVITGQGILLEKIASFVSDFASMDSHLHLVYVPHPSEGLDYVDKIKSAANNHPRIHIMEKQLATTERVIIDSVAHVSIYSSCHFDAIHFKDKTYILDVLENNIMTHYANLYPDKFLRIKDVGTLLDIVLHEKVAYEN